MHSRRATAAATLLAALLAVTGCTSSGGDSDTAANDEGGAARAAQQEQEAAPADEETSGQGSGAGGGSRDSGGADAAADPVRLAPEALIRTAGMTIRTKDIEQSADDARTATESAGGYVGNESTSRATDGSVQAELTLRVPAEEYEGVLDGLSDGGLGKVIDRDVNVKDVTDQVVDVESRISSQRASVDRIRKLMNEATKLGDVVTLESELSTRQANLEALLAQQQSLEDRTTLGTIDLELLKPGAAEEKKDEDDETTVGNALTGGWDAFVTGLRGIAIAVSASLPFLAAAALLVLAWRLLRRFLPKRPVTPPPSPFAPPSAPRASEEP